MQGSSDDSATGLSSLSTIWSGFEENPIALDECRAHGRFLFQADRAREAYLRSFELLAAPAKWLTGPLGEDGAFGAVSHIASDGTVLTRDLLDSAAEIGFLLEHLDAPVLDSVVDIGSGYGRLAHRISALRPNATVICADEVPSSRRICEGYLTRRGVTGFAIADFQDAGQLVARHRPRLATAVHSFPEMPIERIQAWLQLLADEGVEWVFLVPNEPDRLKSTELDGSRHGFLDVLNGAGYQLTALGWKYPSGEKDAYSTNLVYQDQYRLYRQRNG